MKPMYKWLGGKSQELSKITEFMPKEFDRYIEPFFGGGSMYFHLENDENIINDLNPEVVNFLNTIKTGKGALIYEVLKKWRNEPETYYKIRSNEPDSAIIKAARFYYLRKTCFRGLVRYNKKGKFNVAYGHYKTYNFEELLDKNYFNILKNTNIHNSDFSNVFKKYNEKKDFCFLDPPYHMTMDKYGSDGFDDEQHLKLSKCFKKSNMKCLMIIGKTNYIEELYSDYITGFYNKKYVITTHVEKVPESVHLIIKNF